MEARSERQGGDLAAANRELVLRERLQPDVRWNDRAQARWRTAIHEAGHAILVYHVDAPIIEVRVGVSGHGGARCVVWDAGRVDAAARGKVCVGSEQALRLAGLDTVYCGQDLDEALARAIEAGGRDGAAHRVAGWRAEARAVLLERAEQLVVLTRALHDQQILTGVEVVDVISPFEPRRAGAARSARTRRQPASAMEYR